MCHIKIEACRNKHREFKSQCWVIRLNTWSPVMGDADKEGGSYMKACWAGRDTWKLRVFHFFAENITVL